MITNILMSLHAIALARPKMSSTAARPKRSQICRCSGSGKDWIAIASLPLHVYRNDDNGAVPAPEHRLYRLLHFAPNPEMTSFTFRETMMGHLLLYGNAYAQVMRDGGGRARALYPLPPYKMDVHRNDDGTVYYTYYRDRDESRPGQKDGMVGLSPVAMARNVIGLSLATEKYGANFFANSANPGGIIETTHALKDVAPDAIRKAWEALYKGNNNRVAILTDGMTFKKVSVTPEEAQFLEQWNYQSWRFMIQHNP